jgi:glutathione S-transferase
MLEELEVPYALVRVNVKERENRTPEYLATVHPHGHVPALRDGDHVMFESAAICLYLADKFPEKRLAPPVGSIERMAYYQWVVYSMAELEVPIAAWAKHTQSLPEGQRLDVVADEARKKFRDCADVLTRHLETRTYMLGEQFTAADVMIAGVLNWARVVGLTQDLPVVEAYRKRCIARAAFQRSRVD